MKRALVILYYWPPAGGSAVQRWLKFCRYLPENGWEPVVFAPEEPDYPEVDENLEKEVPKGLKILRLPIMEPHQLYKRFIGIKKEEKLGASMTLKTEPKGFKKVKNDVALYIRSNVFIPDARFLWIRPAVKFLKRYLKDNPVDVIITTGPPHSLHLIGYHLHKSLKVKWVADFRDPWTSIDFYSELKLTRWADKRHHTLEARVLRTADQVVAIGPNMQDEFRRIGARNIVIITNGFDDADLADPAKKRTGKKFSIVHLGTLSAMRNAPALWQALADKAKEDRQFASDLEIKLIGNIDHTVLKDLEEHRLDQYLTLPGFIPHQEGIRILAESEVLLLLINNSVNAKGVITGKFFEYLAAGRPILLIGPSDGDAARILKECDGGLTADFNDAGKIREHLDHLYNAYKNGEQFLHSSSVRQYSRRELTVKLGTALDKITAGKSSPVAD